MSSKIKIDGAWRDAEAPYAKVGGAWRVAKSAWVKIDDTWKSWFLQGGLNDNTFTEFDVYRGFYSPFFGFGISDTVNALAVQPDGKIVLGGAFTVYNGVTVNRIIRLNPDGSLDRGFTENTSSGFNNTVFAVTIQPDGKILLGGSFTTFNGENTSRVARLNADGTRDTTFRQIVLGGGIVFELFPLEDESILAAGQISQTSALGDLFFLGLVKLDPSGFLDETFQPIVVPAGSPSSATFRSISVQGDGKIIVGGDSSPFGRCVRFNPSGTRDTTFTTNLGSSFNNTILDTAIQPDGKIISVGTFTTLNGATVNRIARLNSDGTPDTAFTTATGSGFNNTARSLAVQSSGEVFVGGSFTEFNGSTTKSLILLNSDGTRNTAFTDNAGEGFNNFSAVNTLSIQPTNKIYAGGSFDSFDNEKIRSAILLNTDGTRNTEFIPSTGTGFDSYPQKVAFISQKIVAVGGFTTFNNEPANYIVSLYPDGSLNDDFASGVTTGFDDYANDVVFGAGGKLIVGGDFTEYNGVSSSKIARLNGNGTLDTTYATNIGSGFNGTVISLVSLSEFDGSIIAGGSFTSFDGNPSSGIARLSLDGFFDTEFGTNIGSGVDSGYIYSLLVQPDGYIVAGGVFMDSFDGTPVNGIFRLLPDGILDEDFIDNVVLPLGTDVFSVALQPDGKIVIGGQGIVSRLNSDGTPDTAFTANIPGGPLGTFYSVLVQPNGKILLGGFFSTWGGVAVNNIVRLNPDGTRDTAFTVNSGTGFNTSVQSLALQPDGKILAGGEFTGFNGINRNGIARIGGDLAL
jgi:uncharacterized delta-60 repeat protein